MCAFWLFPSFPACHKNGRLVSTRRVCSPSAREAGVGCGVQVPDGQRKAQKIMSACRGGKTGNNVCCRARYGWCWHRSEVMLPGLSISVLAAGAVVALEESAGRQTFAFPAGFTREVGVGDGTLENFRQARRQGTGSFAVLQDTLALETSEACSSRSRSSSGTAQTFFSFAFCCSVAKFGSCLNARKRAGIKVPLRRKRESPMHGPPTCALGNTHE